MKEKCIFRCEKDGRKYRVMEVPEEHATRGVVYVTYIGRSRLEPIIWYNQGYAIKSVLSDAFGKSLWKDVRKVL